MHILNKGFHLLTDFAFADFFLKRLQALDFIAGQCVTQHGNKGTIAGKKDRMGLLMLLAFFRGYIKANKCFSCTGHTSHEDDMLFSLTRRLLDQFLNPFGSNLKISGPGVVPRNRFHRMSRVKALSGLDDGGRWLIWRRTPFFSINGICIDGREGDSK